MNINADASFSLIPVDKEECETYELTTAAEDDEEQLIHPRPKRVVKKRTFEDFVEGMNRKPLLSMLFDIVTFKKEHDIIVPVKILSYPCHQQQTGLNSEATGLLLSSF